MSRASVLIIVLVLLSAALVGWAPRLAAPSKGISLLQEQYGRVQRPVQLSSSFVTRCMSRMHKYCSNQGRAECRWLSNNCGFKDMMTGGKKVREVLKNKKLVVLGDSVARDTFNGILWQCCAGSLQSVTKENATVTKRTPVMRNDTKHDIVLVFRFDFMPDHLTQGMATDPAVRGADIIVVSLGMHMGFRAAQKTEPWQTYASHLGHRGICRAMNFPEVIIFIGQMVECQTMAHHKQSVFRKQGESCPDASKYIETANAEIAVMVQRMRPFEPCAVYYIPALVCDGRKNVCTVDGMHSKGARYLRGKADMLVNALALHYASSSPVSNSTPAPT